MTSACHTVVVEMSDAMKGGFDSAAGENDAFHHIIAIATHQRSVHAQLLAHCKTKNKEIQALTEERAHSHQVISGLLADNKCLLDRIKCLSMEKANNELQTENNKRQKIVSPEKIEKDTHLQEQLKQAQEELAAAQHKASDLEDEVDAANAKNAELKEELAAVRVEATNQDKDEVELGLENEYIAFEVQSRHVVIDSTRANSTDEVHSLKKDLAAAKQTNVWLGKELSTANRSLMALNIKVTDLETKTVALSEREAETNQRFTAVMVNLDAVTKDKARLTGDLAENKRLMTTKESELFLEKHSKEKLLKQHRDAALAHMTAETKMTAQHRQVVEDLQRTIEVNHRHFVHSFSTQSAEIHNLRHQLAVVTSELRILRASKP